MELQNKRQLYTVIVCRSLKQWFKNTENSQMFKAAKHKLKAGVIISDSGKFRVFKHYRIQKTIYID